MGLISQASIAVNPLFDLFSPNWSTQVVNCLKRKHITAGFSPVDRPSRSYPLAMITDDQHIGSNSKGNHHEIL